MPRHPPYALTALTLTLPSVVKEQYQITVVRVQKTDKNLFSILTPVFYNFGGGERDRTDDLLLAKQALSQLSYTPYLRLQATD
jgi:hypothetical protein